MKKLDNSEVLLGPVQLAYAFVFKPRLNNSKDIPVEEYSVTVRIPKENTDQFPNAKQEYEQFKRVIIDVAKAKFGNEPKDLKGKKLLLRDGDEENTNGEKPHEGYYYFTAISGLDYPPILIDGAKNKVGPNSGWGSGDVANVKIRLYAYDKKTNKGVAAGLTAIQFISKGDFVGGRPSEEKIVSDFDSVEGAQPSASDDEYDPFSDQ